MNKESTIREAKEYLRSNYEKGIDCPCCGRLVKLWKYKMRAAMVQALFFLKKLQNNDPDGWVNVQKDFKEQYGATATAMGYSLLQWWGLAEPKNDIAPDGKRASGYWRITQKGMNFIFGYISVPEYAQVYDNKLVGHSGKEISVKQALGNKFDYNELMQ